MFSFSLLTFTITTKIKQQIAEALCRLAEGKHLQGHHRMAELMAKEALSLLLQVPHHKWTPNHIQEMDRSSLCVAVIARQMGRYTEAEAL